MTKATTTIKITKRANTYKVVRDADDAKAPNVANHHGPDGKVLVEEMTATEIMSAIAKKPYYHEHIQKGTPVVPYFDIDATIPTECTPTEVDDYTRRYMNIIRKAFKKVFADGRIYYATGHGRAIKKGVTLNKFSVHAVIRGIGYYENNAEIKAEFMESVNTALNKYEMKKFKTLTPETCTLKIDDGVYKSAQNLRLPGCYKKYEHDILGNSRIVEIEDDYNMLPQTGIDSVGYRESYLRLFKLYLVTNISGEEIKHSEKIGLAREPGQIIDNSVIIDSGLTEAHIADLIKMCGRDSDAYADWFAMMCAIIYEAERRNFDAGKLAHAFSKLSPHKYEPEEVDVSVANIRDEIEKRLSKDGNQANVLHLYNRAKHHEPAKYADWLAVTRDFRDCNKHTKLSPQQWEELCSEVFLPITTPAININTSPITTITMQVAEPVAKIVVGNQIDINDLINDEPIIDVVAEQVAEPIAKQVAAPITAPVDNTATLQAAAMKEFFESGYSDREFAELFKQLYGKHFIYQNKTLFHFNGVHWVSDAENAAMLMISGEFYDMLLAAASKVFSTSADSDKLKRAFGEIRTIGSESRGKKILESIKRLVENKFIEFDTNDFLIAFNNGVYNLETAQFSKVGEPTDYISISTGYDYKEPTAEETEFITSFIAKIVPDEAERSYIMRHLSTGLCGTNLQYFGIFTGVGSNGKSVLIDLIAKALGDYAYNGNIGVLTTPMKGGPNPELANMHKKRFVYFNEAAIASPIHAANLNAITGSAEINARACHANTTRVILNSTNIILTNDIPLINGMNGGAARRIKVCQFDSLFKTREEIETIYQDCPDVFEGNEEYTSMKFRLKYRHVMFSVLLKYFTLFVRDNKKLLNIPARFEQLSQEYLLSCEELYGWFHETYTHTGDANDFVTMVNLFDNYKQSEIYINMKKEEKRRFNKTKLQDIMLKTTEFKKAFKEQHSCKDETGKRLQPRSCFVGYKLTIDNQETPSFRAELDALIDDE